MCREDYQRPGMSEYIVNMNMQSYLLGVDGGGSSTIAWIASGDGSILAKGGAGPSNIKAVGESAALEALEEAIASAMTSADKVIDGSIYHFDAACFGLAGIDHPEDRKLIEKWNEERKVATSLVLVNDGELVLAAGTQEGWGVAVIAGTGSIVVGRNADGQTARAGGWGHLFGDEGSGYGTAIAALRLVAERYDGRKKKIENDVLTRTICRAVGVDDPSALVSAIYGPGFDRAKIAALTETIVAAAECDASIVRDLLEPAGIALAHAALAVAERLNLPRKELPLAMAGGFVLSCEIVSQTLQNELARAGYRCVACRVDEPVRGAIALAQRALNGTRLAGA